MVSLHGAIVTPAEKDALPQRSRSTFLVACGVDRDLGSEDEELDRDEALGAAPPNRPLAATTAVPRAADRGAPPAHAKRQP